MLKEGFFCFFVYVLAVLGHSKILGTTKDYTFAFCINFFGSCKENSITENCNSVLCIINARLHLMFLHFKDVCYPHTLELWLFVFYIQSRWWRVFHKGESFGTENIIWMSYKLIVFKTEYYCWYLYIVQFGGCPVWMSLKGLGLKTCFCNAYILTIQLLKLAVNCLWLQ